MRKFVIGLLGAASFAVAAHASPLDSATAIGEPPPPLDSSGVAIPIVVPGEQMAIACDALDTQTAIDNVRVVMQLTPTADEDATGYGKLLATNEEMLKGAVRIRVPDAPDLENHVVHVKVYVVGGKGAQSCDAGSVKIA